MTDTLQKIRDEMRDAVRSQITKDGGEYYDDAGIHPDLVDDFADRIDALLAESSYFAALAGKMAGKLHAASAKVARLQSLLAESEAASEPEWYKRAKQDEPVMVWTCVYRDAAKALYVGKTAPERHVLVPADPTAKMVIHGVRAAKYYAQPTTDMVEDCWRAMIAAAKEGEE